MWNSQQRNDFAHAYVLTSKMFDKEITVELAKMVTDDLQDLEFDKCYQALVVYRRDNRNKTWPKTSDIRAIVNPSLDKRILAIELARKIDKAVSTHGYNWAWGEQWKGETVYRGGGALHWTFKEAVIAEVGEIGWHTICARGGWQHVRDSANNMEEGTFIAQMREQINATITLKEQGIDITKIEMPSKEMIGDSNRDLLTNLKLIKSEDKT